MMLELLLMMIFNQNHNLNNDSTGCGKQMLRLRLMPLMLSSSEERLFRYRAKCLLGFHVLSTGPLHLDYRLNAINSKHFYPAARD